MRRENLHHLQKKKKNPRNVLASKKSIAFNNKIAINFAVFNSMNLLAVMEYLTVSLYFYISCLLQGVKYAYISDTK